MTLQTNNPNEPPKLVRVDMKYLCPNDPNKDKILAADGWVLPGDGPIHDTGWIDEQKVVTAKHRTFKNGREVEFETHHTTAVRICQKCGGRTVLDPYP